MIYRLLALSLSLHSTWACVPVRPGEDMPCPSVPTATAADNYVLNGLKGPTIENGAMVYQCDGNDEMLEVVGTTATKLAAGAKITCKPNSGQFVTDDGKPVGAKKYNCGEDLIKCPDFPKAAVLPTGVTVSDPMMTMSNGDTVWSCAAPSTLWQVLMNDPATMSSELVGKSSIVCKRQSGKLSFDDGTVIDDADMQTFACGIRPCQTCDMTIFKDSTIAACPTQANIFCTSKPTAPAGPDGCPAASCGDVDQLFMITSAMESMAITTTNLKCMDGVWQNMGTALPTNMGLVCGKPATCDAKCNDAVTDAYDKDVTIGMITGSVVKAKPTCTYKCPQGSNMLVGATPHTSVSCDMLKAAAMDNDAVKTENGVVLSGTNKFSCLECMCNAQDLNAGDMGACPVGKLCAAPTSNTQCEAVCPPDSTGAYLDMNGNPKTSPTIKCVGGIDWIEAGFDMTAGVTCAYADGKGTMPIQPDTPACPKLTPLDQAGCNAVATTCDSNLLVYYFSGGGYSVTCKTGSIITDQTGLDDQLSFECSTAGTWSRGITKATCVTDGSQFKMCKDSLTDASTTAATMSCALGACYFTCPGNQQFQYTYNGGTQGTAKNLKCYAGSFSDPTLQQFVEDPAMAKCV